MIKIERQLLAGYFTFILFVLLSLSGNIHRADAGQQHAFPLKITDIQISGNTRTKPFVILRELKIKKNSSVTLEELEAERKRIQNLGLFTRVEMQLLPAENDFILAITVTEKWYLFPYPIYFRHEKSWKKWSYGFGVAHLNFRGRNETVDFSFYLGYSKKINLSYSIPWFIPRWKIYSAINLFAAKDNSKNLDVSQFTENRQTFAYSLGKRFGFFTYLDFALSYNHFSTNNTKSQNTLSPTGKDKWFSYYVTFRYDSRDLHEFPRTGWRIKAFWQKAGRNSSVINYSRYGLDGRRYFSLPLKFILAMRGNIALSRGRIPLYDHLYLGLSERIRGHFYDKYEGENRCIGGLALRFPLRKVTYHSFYQDTPVAAHYRNLKFGISAGLFVDVGSVWYRQQTLKESMFIKGFGAGLFLHLPYVNLARIEYAFDENFNSQLILFDLGVAF